VSPDLYQTTKLLYKENVYLHYSLWLICTITPPTTIHNPNPAPSHPGRIHAQLRLRFS